MPALNLMFLLYDLFMSLSNDFYKLAILSLLAFFVFTYTRISFAQEAVNAPTIDSPPTTNTTGAADDSRFNAAWLLPLIAIPILLYMLWPKDREEESMDFSGSYAGVKGGRAERHEEKKNQGKDEGK